MLSLAFLLWTPPGHRLIAWIAFQATAGEVRIDGLEGALPGHALARSVELRDAGGPWLRISNAEVSWSPLSALRNHYEIQLASAAKVELLRRPLPSKSREGSPSRIDIYRLWLPHIDIAPSLLGHPAMLAAQGSLNFTTIHEFGVDLIVTRPGGPDRYAAKGYVSADVVHGKATILESPDGLFGKLIGLPGLGPVALSAQASGDRHANEISVALKAGALKAGGKGTFSLAAHLADIDFSAASPAMQLDAETGWTSLAVQGHAHGPFAAPQINATLQLDHVRVAGLTLDSVAAEARGEGGSADATANIVGLHLPGRYADLFAAQPVTATLHADLAKTTRMLRFAVRHPLLALDGHASMAGTRTMAVNVTVPSLAPFAAKVGADLKGRATLSVNLIWAEQKLTFNLQGGIRAEGASLLARMLGRDARLSVHTLVSGSDLQDSRVRMAGAGFDTRIDGAYRGGRMDFRVDTALTDLARLTPVLNGAANLSGSVRGDMARAQIDLAGAADLASRGFSRQRVVLKVRATGLPNPGEAHVSGNGRFDDAPFALAADWIAAANGHAAKVSLNWKSLAARADLAVPQKGAPGGRATLDVKNLNDLTGFVGESLGGGLKAAAGFTDRDGKEQIALHLDAQGLRAADARLDRVQTDGTIADALGVPRLDMRLAAQGFATAGVTGSAKAELSGSLDALAATLSADLKDKDAQPAHVAAHAVVQVPRSQLRLDRLVADWRGQALSLLQPALIDLANGLAVDRLDLKAAGGVLHVAGRVLPKLALSASASNVQLSALRSFMPRRSLEGVVNARADLSGTPAAPMGVVTVNAKGLRMAGYSSGLAPADLSASATLDGSMAQLDAKLVAGTSGALALTGAAPLSPNRAMDLHLSGNANLGLLNPLLAADGRQIQGRLVLDTGVTGTMAAPRLSGTASLTEAAFQDFTQGLRLHAMTADLRADGTVIHVIRFQAQADPGAISGSGTLDIGHAGWPVDFALSARDARPIASDMVTASLTGDLKLAGKLRQSMTLSGKLAVPRAEINIPDSFPPEVRTLNIRRRGEKPPPPPPAATTLALDLSVASTGPVIVRGHGIDADLGGQLQLAGSTGAPRIGGGFDMRRGTLTVAGQVLDFTTGKLGFDGSGVRNRLDPTLNFVAQTISGGVTATLAVGGYASQPKITLSSSPQLPQDEVLAHLLFQQSAKQLTPLQLAQIAQALAALSGISNGFDPVASVRGGLGLDRLSVSGGTGATTGTSVEAGKYVSHNVYIGARQSLSGSTQAQVQIDITKNLKAQATISNSTNATATQGAAAQDNGNSVGLSYQFEY